MGETRGLNFVPEPESDGSDIRGYPNPRVKLPSLPTSSEAAVRGDPDAAEVATPLRVSPGNCGVILPHGGDHPVPGGLDGYIRQLSGR